MSRGVNMSKFKVGDKVICTIDSYFDCITRLKEYVVKRTEYDKIQVVDDDGDDVWYYAYRFEKVEEKNMNNFTKDMLKTGMTVKLRGSNDKYMVIVGDIEMELYDKQSLVLIGHYGFFLGDGILDDLTSIEGESVYDIVEVYDTKLIGFDSLLKNKSTLLWKRVDKTEEEIQIEQYEQEIDNLKKNIELLKSKINS